MKRSNDNQEQSRPQVEKIYPKEAAVLLETRNTANRPLKEYYARQLANDIIANQWKLDPSPIVFDTGGVLLDGQHRLRACVIANMAIHVWVMRNVDPDIQMILGSGMMRNTADTATLLGRWGTVKSQHIATASAMARGLGRSVRRTTSERIHIFDTHSEAVVFAVEHMGTAAIVSVAPVCAAIARAWYHVSLDTLQNFASVLQTGIMASHEDAAAALLRTWIVTDHAKARRKNANPDRRIVYGKTERAIDLFVRRQRPTRIGTPSQELFPLPGETIGQRKTG